MIWIGYIFTVLAITGLFALKAGMIDILFLKIDATMALILLIPFYFMSRANKAPTRTESWLAAAWVIIRRLVGTLAFLMISGVCTFATIQSFEKGFSFSGAASVIFGLLMSLFILWKCWYGEGESKLFSDDRSSHEERKNRYNWK